MKVKVLGNVLADDVQYETGKIYDVDEKTAKNFPHNMIPYDGDDKPVEVEKRKTMVEKTIKKGA